jgi:hypothetical protein
VSEVLQHRAERLKLARLLAVDVDALPTLDGVPAADLATFRDRVTDRLFDESARHLGRVGAASRLVPAAITATIALKAFGPLLCARAAGAIDPAKAVDVAGRLPADFLADVTVELDPRRVADIIARVPADLVLPVATELGRREEHVTMGRFLAFVPDGPLEAALAELDDETMLRTAFVLEHKDRLDRAVGLLAPDRVPGILRCASEHGLWPEALDLLGHLSDQRLGPIADDLAALGDEVVAGMVDAVCDAGLWASLLPVVRLASPEARVRFAGSPAFHSDRALTGIVTTAATTAGLWSALVPLLEALPADVRTRVAEIAGTLDADDLRSVIDDALRQPATITSLVGLYLQMDDAGRSAVRDAATRARRTTDLDAALESES